MGRMRRLIAILLSLSLSWVTTGYACDMPGMQHAVQQTCCCEPDAAEPCRNDERCAMAQGGAACCQMVSATAADLSDTAAVASSFAFDIQPMGPAPAPVGVTHIVQTSRHTLRAAWPQAPPSGWGTHTYLETARLRI